MEPIIREGLIPIARLQELFSYDPETGVIMRLIDSGRGIAGQVFSSPNISIDGTHFRASRIAWALHNGIWPPDGYWVDHKDGIKANNRIDNLRLATPTQNQQNKAGYGAYAKGVTWRNRIENPFQAKIRVNGYRIHLGSFATEEEAAEAYRQAAIQYHGEFACLE